MATKDNNTIKYNQGEKSIKLPFDLDDTRKNKYVSK